MPPRRSNKDQIYRLAEIESGDEEEEVPSAEVEQTIAPENPAAAVSQQNETSAPAEESPDKDGESPSDDGGFYKPPPSQSKKRQRVHFARCLSQTQFKC